MKIISSVFILFLLSLISDLHIKTVIPVRADKIYVDNFENIFVISGSTLIKYNSEGLRLSSYTDSYNESISLIDIKNPLKLLVYFENQNRIIFLDNNLNPVGHELLLETKSLFGNILVCSAENGGIWIFDSSENTIIKYDSSFREIFRKVIFEINGTPDFLTTGNNLLYLKTVAGTVYVYDNLGNFDYKINKKIVTDFFATNNLLHYFNAETNSFVSYNPELNDSLLIALPDSVNTLNVVKSSHYLIFNDKTHVYISKIVNEKINTP